MVRTTLSFRTRLFKAKHVPGASLDAGAHSHSPTLSCAALRAARAATVVSAVLVTVACGGGGDSAEAAPPAGVLDALTPDASTSGAAASSGS